MSLCINTLSGLCECRICCRILNIRSPLFCWWGESWCQNWEEQGRSLQLFYALSACWTAIVAFLAVTKRHIINFMLKASYLSFHKTNFSNKCHHVQVSSRRNFLQVIFFPSVFCLLESKFDLEKNVTQGQSQWQWARVTYCSSYPITCLFRLSAEPVLYVKLIKDGHNSPDVVWKNFHSLLKEG